jgi:hypothetical protein
MIDNSEWGIQGVVFTTDYEYSTQRNYKKGVVFATVGSLFFAIIIVSLLILSSLLGVVSEIVSEIEELEEIFVIPDDSNNIEYGYRLDVNSNLYMKLAANEYPFNSGSDYPDFSSTVYIEGPTLDDDNLFYSGSGVVISEYFIMTAAHVIDNISISDTVIFVGDDFEKGYESDWYSAEEFHFHPGWMLDEDESERLHGGVDIALIELSRPISGVEPATWANSSELDDILFYELVYTSGFGGYDSEFSDCGESCLDDGSGYFSKKRAWSNSLDRIKDDISPFYHYPGKGGWNGGLLATDFDSLSNNPNSLSEEGNEESFKFGIFDHAGKGGSNSTPTWLEGISVPGDSGGPTFVKIGYEWVVIGITSFGQTYTGDYGSVTFDTRVSSHVHWICSISDSNTPIDGC